MKNLLKSTLVLLLLFSCSTIDSKNNDKTTPSNTPTPQKSEIPIKNTPIEKKSSILKIGDQIEVFAGTYIKLDSLVNDSRCPANVQCVWAGEAKFNFVLIENDKEIEKFTLSTASAELSTKKFDKFSVVMKDVSSGKTSEYSLTLEVTVLK